MSIKFRNLRADEIEVRPTDTKGGKATLLLYKDARTDRRILDETVGPENWQCDFYEVNGATFCKVGIWDETKEQWIWKSDCGTESNIEKEKGLASDCFKRACFRWGLGVELYATPRIKIKCPSDWYLEDRLTMTFYVRRFEATGENVDELEIVNRFGEVVYSLEGKKADDEGRKPVQKKKAPKEEEPEEYDDRDTLDILKDFCSKKAEEGENKVYLKDFYTYYRDKIENGFEPRSFPALWKKWVESPNRNKK